MSQCTYLKGIDRQLKWQDVPLRIPKRCQNVLEKFEIETLEQIDDVLKSGFLICPETMMRIPISELRQFGVVSIANLIGELKKISRLGLTKYRYGTVDQPKTAKDIIKAFLRPLTKRQQKIFKSLCRGLTHESVGELLNISCERVRQLKQKALESALQNLKESALKTAQPMIDQLRKELVMENRELRSLLGIKLKWKLRLFFMIVNKPFHEISPNSVSVMSRCQIKSVKHLIWHSVISNRLKFENGLVDLKALSKHHKSAIEEERKRYSEVIENNIRFLSSKQLLTCFGKQWLIKYIRRQISPATSNGISFDEIDTLGLIESPNELSQLISHFGGMMRNGNFRSMTKLGLASDEVIEILRASPTPLQTENIMARTTLRNWNSTSLNYALSERYETVRDNRGIYMHIDLIRLTLSDVENIRNWGFDLIHRKKLDRISCDELYTSFKKSRLSKSKNVSNKQQLFSIVAKHSKLRRLGDTYWIEVVASP